MSSTFVIPKSLRIGEFITLIFCFGLTTLAVLARTYAKLRLSKDMRVEDYMSLLAWSSFMGYIGLGIVIGNNEGGIVHTAYLSAIENTLYTIIIVIVKLSILLQYITIFTPQRQGSFYYSIHVLIWTNTLYYTITTILYMNVCSPRRKLWDPTIHGHCISSNGFGVSSGALNVISDFSILLLPLPLIWRLQMPINKKISVTVVFGFGLFGCIISVLRLIYSVDLLHEISGTPTFQVTEDKIGLLSFAEIAIGIMVGCSPVLPKFFKNLSFKDYKLSERLGLSPSSNGRKSWLGRFRKSAATNDPKTSATESFSQSISSSQKSEDRAPRIVTLKFPHDSFPSHVSQSEVPVQDSLPSLNSMELESQTEAGKSNGHCNQACPDTITQQGEKGPVNAVNVYQRTESMIQPAARVYIPNSP